MAFLYDNLITFSDPGLQDFVVLLSPYAPHIAEELWQQLGHSGSIAYQPWPVHDPALLVETTVALPVQVPSDLGPTTEAITCPGRVKSRISKVN